MKSANNCITILAGTVACLLGMTATMTTAETTEVAPYQNPKLPISQRVEDLLGRMTLEEKISIVSGKAGDATRDIERLGIPSLRVTDGPHGVGWGVKSTAFPTAVSMASSWNPDLVEAVGVALGDETRAFGRHVLLGPCINIHRTPLGGRNFESFSEDPYLAARMAVAYVKGVQSRNIGTSVKHYALNNQEWERLTISVEIDERALREIYLPAFHAAVTEADPWTVMGAYNKVRGKWCCENTYLLDDILKGEWGFKGLVVSDWGAVHSTVSFAQAGLDLEMPGPGAYFGDKLLQAVKDGEVSERIIDEKVRRILGILFRAGLFEQPDNRFTGAVNTPEHKNLARRLAEEAIVLLKNENNVLPLDAAAIKTLAVIGPNAEPARVGGGGSSTVAPANPVGVLQGLRTRAGSNIEIRYIEGCSMSVSAVPADALFCEFQGKTVPGLVGEYFTNKDLEGTPTLVRVDSQVNFEWGDGSPAAEIPCDNFSARWTGKLRAPRTGSYNIGVVCDDGVRLYINDQLVIDQWVNQAGITHTVPMEMKEGDVYNIRMEYFEYLGAASAQLGWSLPDSTHDEAAALAAGCDAAIVVVGLSPKFEGEGVDRNTLALPGNQNKLIQAVVAANPRTAVVLINGTPIDMQAWIDQVPAIVEAWYPGEMGGDAVARVLFGDVNPSGKLPDTFAKKLEDYPSQANFPGHNGVVRYEEGIWVGYRFFDTKNVEPLFPFGHGLSYTTFEYDNLRIEPDTSGNRLKINVTFDVRNTGTRAGAEVAQLYVHDVQSAVERPTRELKGFRKVRLQPGEMATITLTLDTDSLSYYDINRKRWFAEPGEFEFQIGSSSRDIRLRGVYVFEGR